MASNNISSLPSSVFLLEGIPGLKSYHVWISIPFFVMYVTSVLGNLLLLFFIMVEPQLHSPMYYFLYALFLMDLIVSNSIAIKIFCIFWLNDPEITSMSCFIQMFFVHCFSSIESGVLMAMAFDRYMAICDPLHYTTTLTNALILKIVTSLVIRSTIIVIPCPWMASRLPYCQSHLIPHSYCDHMAVVKLACIDTTTNSVYGLTVVLIVIAFDMSCIAVSYTLILRAVLRLSSTNAKKKAFGTCTSHLSIILMVYTLGLFSFLTYRIGHTAPYIHVIISNLYLLIPPSFNPIIYGVKTKEIRTAALHLFTYRAS